MLASAYLTNLTVRILDASVILACNQMNFFLTGIPGIAATPLTRVPESALMDGSAAAANVGWTPQRARTSSNTDPSTTQTSAQSESGAANWEVITNASSSSSAIEVLDDSLVSVTMDDSALSDDGTSLIPSISFSCWSHGH